VLFKIHSRTKKEYALGQSEEEVVTPLVRSRITTYKELPLAVYQIHWKYRDELRAKSGILRGREFLMKDMYSFHATQEDFDRFYAVAKAAYLKIFQRLGLTAKVTEASGGTFSEKISYEFMVLTDAGEDDILFCTACDFCVNANIAKHTVGGACPRCGKGTLARAKASEVGNVFDLGQKYGKDIGLSFADRDGKPQHPVMCCYGIGISRLMGVLAETFHDKHGVLWPAAVAPAAVHVVELSGSRDASAEVHARAEETAQQFAGAGCSVLYDDRPDVRPGEKFADADLLGIPYRAVVSEKTGPKIEVKKRNKKFSKLTTVEELVKGRKKEGRKMG
jgi:prolyl-tRNA synthetase